jgi:flavin reductase (DIM6/NTAB) family NADH-FMN oxidoreductase RutF
MKPAPAAPGPFRPVDLAHASRLINHGPTVLVTSTDGVRSNVMAAAWSMPVEFSPPRVAVVIDKHTLTWEWVRASGCFGVCVPGAAWAERVHAVGSVSGRAVDKLARYGIAVRTDPLLGVPVIEQGCSAWLACRLIPEPHTQSAYDTCFAEVVAAAADPRVFADGRWSFRDDNADLHTLHYLGGGQFARVASVVSVPVQP